MRNFKTKKKRVRKKILKLAKLQDQLFGVPLEEVQNLTIGSVRKIAKKVEERIEMVQQVPKKRSEQEQVKKLLRSYIEEQQRREKIYEELDNEVY